MKPEAKEGRRQEKTRPEVGPKLGVSVLEGVQETARKNTILWSPLKLTPPFVDRVPFKSGGQLGKVDKAWLHKPLVCLNPK